MFLVKYIFKLLHVATFLYICVMRREIITFGNHFEQFIKTLNEKEIKKLDYLLTLLRTEQNTIEKSS